ncbi:DMT family transporter [Effusibacillus consociatus]|uniref:DMT family transporter n=1 Tax=Effusibacillus consociatus TaxID=1117041 RepID=A0ABV9Q4Y7_9BACL
MQKKLLFVVLCLVWGSTWLAIKIGVNEVPPLWLAGTRFFMAGLLLVIWYRWKEGPFKIDKKDWLPILKLGFLVIAVTFGLIFWGEQWVSSGLTAVLVQGLIPIFMYIFSSMYGYDRFNLTRGIGILLGIAGILIIFLPVIKSPDTVLEFFGMLAITVGTLAYCWGSVMSKDTLNKYSTILVSGFENLFGGLLLMAVSPFFEWSELMSGSLFFAGSSLMSWLYLVLIGSIVGFTIYIYLLKEWGAVRVSVYSFITPVVALLLGAMFYDETITVSKVIGTLVILLGVWVTTRAGQFNKLVVSKENSSM